jgi:hypothetical protein
MIDWRDLNVNDADGVQIGRLGEVLKTDDSVGEIIVNRYGVLAEWADHLVYADGETPAWHTPDVLVDWAGFSAAVNNAWARVTEEAGE